MVLQKRKADGEFVTWTPGGQAPTPNLDLPLAKKPRTEPTNHTVYTSSREAKPSNKPFQAQSSYTRAIAEPAPSAPPMVTMLPKAMYTSYPASDDPQAGPSQPHKPKKSRKKADPHAPAPEKRGAIFKKSCPKNILDRVERVMLQRFFMIDRQKAPGELKEIFNVLGSTGNVYTVTIDHKPRCNCPDALKGNHCKHILFIFLKVLQVTQRSGVWYQKALLTSELETIFAEAPIAPNSISHPQVREAYARATGKATGTNTQTSPNNKRVPGPDDDCPICYDTMHGSDESLLTFCEQCGNAVHRVCFQHWQTSNANTGKPPTCVFCRAPWAKPAADRSLGSTGAGRTSEGYLNLNVTGVSPVRDTSTYYHGPRRGQRHYGYQDYLD